MYESTVIPESLEWIGGWNDFFETKNESWQIIGDFSELPIFQENELDRASVNEKIVNYLSTALADGVISIPDYLSELKKYKIIS